MRRPVRRPHARRAPALHASPPLALALLALMLAGCAGPRPFSPADWDRTACPDSLAAVEFAALPVAEQEFRREQARRWAGSARDFATQQATCRMLGATAGRLLVDSLNNPGWLTLDSVLADLRHATRWDPTDASLQLRLAGLELDAGDGAVGRRRLAAVWETAVGGPEAGLAIDAALQLSWSYRDDADWPRARAWWQRAHALAPASYVVRVVDGLLLAGEGRVCEANAAAARLEAAPFPEMHLTDLHNLRGPSRGVRPAHSGGCARWIAAMAQYHAGRPDLAWRALQPIRWDQFALPLARRYWRDVALVAEVAGRREAAACLDRAASYWRTLYGGGARRIAPGPVVAGEPGPDVACLVGEDDTYLGGSPFAYACWTHLQQAASPRGPGAAQRYDRARAAVDACLRRGVRRDHALVLSALIEITAGGSRRAAADLTAASRGFTERTAAACASLGGAWNALALLQARSGELPLARDSLDQALACRPESGAYWYNRGLLRSQMGDLAGARDDLRQAVELLPGDERARGLLASVSSRLGGAAPAGQRPVR